MNIREILLKDRQKVFDMTRIFYNSPAVFGEISDEIIYKNIDNCIGNSLYIKCFIFEKNDEIIGYAMTANSYSTEYGGLCVWIEDIYILPEHTGLGISKIFFEYIEGLYKNSAVRFRLEVEENNINAIKSYEKNGFKRLNYIEMTKEK